MSRKAPTANSLQRADDCMSKAPLKFRRWIDRRLVIASAIDEAIADSRPAMLRAVIYGHELFVEGRTDYVRAAAEYFYGMVRRERAKQVQAGKAEEKA